MCIAAQGSYTAEHKTRSRSICQHKWLLFLVFRSSSQSKSRKKNSKARNKQTYVLIRNYLPLQLNKPSYMPLYPLFCTIVARLRCRSRLRELISGCWTLDCLAFAWFCPYFAGGWPSGRTLNNAELCSLWMCIAAQGSYTAEHKIKSRCICQHKWLLFLVFRSSSQSKSRNITAKPETNKPTFW